MLTALLGLAVTDFAWSAQLSFIKKENDGHDKIVLAINCPEKFAGMKVTITYDTKLLSFVRAKKTAATASFLHVVNDKKPGELIIVMASAKGILGDNLALLYLEFDRKEVVTDLKPKISVTQLQLMDENLKEISGNLPEFVF